MDAVLMCGGRGTRLDADVEKPLLEVGGRPMVDRVHAALAGSEVDAVHAVTSPTAPRTREHCRERGWSVVEGAGDGYVADLAAAVDRVGAPVLTAVADLPLLEGEVVDRVLATHEAGSLTVCVPVALKRRLGVSVDAALSDGDLTPAGLNVVAGRDTGDETMTSNDARLAVNVNRPRDAAIAEALL